MEEYKAWDAANEPNLLLICGQPGQGKTFLSIYLAETLANLKDTILLEYYCDYKYGEPSENRNTASGVIRGLMYGMVCQLPELSHILVNQLDEKTNMLVDSSFAALWRLFRHMIQRAGKLVICVVDGLDQCDDSSVTILVRHFEELVSDSSSTNAPQLDSAQSCLKAIFTSRPLSWKILATMKKFPHVMLEKDSQRVQSHIESDVRIFVEAKVDGYFPMDATAEHFVNDTKRDEWYRKTKAMLVEKANGTFLWASFAMEQLENLDPHEVEDELEKLPEGLEALYTRILLQVQDSCTGARLEKIAQLLRLVVVAVRPLLLVEIAAAIHVKTSEDFRPEGIVRGLVANWRGLLTTAEDGTVSFMHQSVKEYLVSQEFNANALGNVVRINQHMVHAELAKTCIYHFQDGSPADGVLLEGHSWNFHLIPALEKSFPLLSYSILNWPIHARLSEQDIFGDKDLFFTEISDPRDTWLDTYWYLTGRLGNAPRLFSLLHMAAFLDLPLLVTRLLNGQFSGPDAKDTHCRTPLWYAASTGNKDTVSLLLQSGAAINSKDDCGQTALWPAASWGHNDVVKMLLESGADIDNKNKSGHTALWQAAATGLETTVELLLKEGAFVDAKNVLDETPLWQAARSGFTSIVKLLLTAGATVNTKDKLFGQTSLAGAAARGHTAIVQLLLEKDAALEAKNNSGETPLSLASAEGRVAVVELLLKTGAIVESKDEFQQTPLWKATSNGHKAIVELLLKNGASINATNTFGRPLLSEAAFWGRTEIVKLLLEEGAFIGVRDRISDQTPLYQAVEMGRVSTVKLLLEKGAEVNIKGSNGRTPLIEAAARGNATIVKLLLENGATMKCESSAGGPWTAMWWAVTRRHTLIESMLLEHRDTEGRADKQVSASNL